MTHAELLNAIMLTYSKGGTRLLRANAGQGWTGEIIHRDALTITLRHYRPFHAHREGVLDLLGWSEPGCVFTAIDAKVGRDRERPAQRTFADLVLSQGGRAGFARSVEEAGRIIRGLPP
jgi:hypothetical protein